MELRGVSIVRKKSLPKTNKTGQGRHWAILQFCAFSRWLSLSYVAHDTHTLSKFEAVFDSNYISTLSRFMPRNFLSFRFQLRSSYFNFIVYLSYYLFYFICSTRIFKKLKISTTRISFMNLSHSISVKAKLLNHLFHFCLPFVYFFLLANSCSGVSVLDLDTLCQQY